MIPLIVIFFYLIWSSDSSFLKRIAVLIVDVQDDAGERGDATQSSRDWPVEEESALRLSQIFHSQKPLYLRSFRYGRESDEKNRVLRRVKESNRLNDVITWAWLTAHSGK